MKLKSLSLILFTVLSCSLFAQESGGKDVRFGLHLDPLIGLYKVDTKGAERDGLKLGFAYGMMMDFRIRDRIFFHSGLSMVQTGGQMKFEKAVYHLDVQEATTDTFRLLDQTTTIKAIHIPLAIKMKTNEIGLMTYYGKFGLDMSYNYKVKINAMDATDEKTNNNVSVLADQLDLSEELLPLRMALLMEIGAEYGLTGNTTFAFGVSMSNPFTNSFKKQSKVFLNENYGSLEQIVKSMYFGLSAGIYF